MLHTVGDLLGSPVIASDGAVGQVLDVFFDEQSWRIRYLLIDVPCAGSDRAVLFAPERVVRIDSDEGIRVDGLPAFDLESAERLRSLRSARAVLDCAVAGWSCDIGRTQDVLFEEGTWLLRFLMIDASRLSPGVVVFVRPDLIQEAHWDRQSLSLAMTRVEVLSMPDPDAADGEVAHIERILH